MADVSALFIRQYEKEVHFAYQNMGSKFRNTVRTKSGVIGSTVQFPKIGAGEATQKGRHANIPAMNLDHTHAVATMEDWYAADYQDKLDELKINHDERQAIVKSGALALGRKSDYIIKTAAETTANTIVVGGTGMTKSKAYELVESMGEDDVFDRGGRNYVWVGFQQFTDLLDIDEFSNMDYLPEEQMPFRESQLMGKRWLGFDWITHSKLSKVGTTRKCLAWNEYSLGHAIGADIKSEINYIPEKASNFINNMMSQGACLIDSTGVYIIECLET